jgi:hypothetical protein
MTTRRFPTTPRDFVQWCVDNGHRNVLTGKVPHDIRNIKSIANRYGYVWKDDLLNLPTNIRSTAMAIEEISGKTSEVPEKTEIKPTELKVVKKEKEQLPPAVRSENWGSW